MVERWKKRVPVGIDVYAPYPRSLDDRGQKTPVIFAHVELLGPEVFFDRCMEGIDVVVK